MEEATIMFRNSSGTRCLKYCSKYWYIALSEFTNPRVISWKKLVFYLFHICELFQNRGVASTCYVYVLRLRSILLKLPNVSWTRRCVCACPRSSRRREHGEAGVAHGARRVRDAAHPPRPRQPETRRGKQVLLPNSSEVSQIGNVDVGMNVDVECHPVGSFTPQHV